MAVLRKVRPVWPWRRKLGWNFFYCFLCFRMRSEGSRFTVGEGKAVFARCCVCGRNRPQPFATVCVRAVRLSTVASAAGRGLESELSGLVTSQLYWRLQRRCLCEWSVAPQLYWRLQRTRVCEWSVSNKSVLQECQVKSVQWECPARVSSKSGRQECQVRVSYKSVK